MTIGTVEAGRAMKCGKLRVGLRAGTALAACLIAAGSPALAQEIINDEDETVIGTGGGTQDSPWVIDDILIVAQSGNGRLDISDGGVVSSTGGFIGRLPGSVGTVSVADEDSTWTLSENLVVGFEGTGTLSIIGGGSITNAISNIGLVAGSTGNASVSGAGSIWTSSGGMTVGDAGVGALDISDGGLVTNGAGRIGYSAGSNGIVTVSGAGSTWTNSSSLSVGNSGTGTLNIFDGGSVSNMIANLGFLTGAVGTANVSGAGSTWTNTGSLSVGNGGTGTLDISDGGLVTNGTGYIAKSTDSTGSVTVAGAGSIWTNSGGLYVSYSGDASLDISAGGVVNSALGYIGSEATGSGAVKVTGAGSTWTNSDALLVGTSGTGTLDIAEAASVSAGSVTIAAFAGSTGTINIGAAAGQAAVAAGTLAASGVSFGQGNGTLQFNHTDSDYIFTSKLIGVGTIRHSAGTTTLAGDSSGFAGGTYIQGGTLYVNGSLGGTIDVTGGTLGGSGSVGDTVIGSGSILEGRQGQTLRLTSLDLRDGSIVNARLGMPGTTALFDVAGSIVLDGTLNVLDADGFGPGLYRLFDYDGTLTDNVLDIGTVPGGVDPADLAFQTSVAGQVNLINSASGGGPSVLFFGFWDGDGNADNGVIEGGDGTWSLTSTNWTDMDGAVNNVMLPIPGFAIFSGSSGTVTADDGDGALSVRGMQFAADGYTLTGDSIELAADLVTGDSTIRVGDGTLTGADITATIGSSLTGNARLVKDDLGTLILTGTNIYTGGTEISSGVLQLGDGGSTGSVTGPIINNASLVFNRSGPSGNGEISGTGSVTKAGPDALSLAGTHSYTGATYVLGGNLFVNGSIASSSLTTVASGAVLGGTGTVGDTRISAGGTLIGLQGNGLTLGSLTLDAGSFVQAQLGAPDMTALFDVIGDLVLDGTLNVDSVGGFGPGIYRIFDYAGSLTDNGMDIGTTPPNFGAADLNIQTATLGQVNLVANIAAAQDLLFWDGDAVGNADNDIIEGGVGTWTLTSPNWTDMDGAVNGAMTPVPGFAIFAGTGGTVTADDSDGALSVTGMQFAADGYMLTGDGLDLVGSGGDAIIRVGDGTATGAAFTATIGSGLTATGRLVKSDFGTLTLTGANSATGSAHVLEGGLRIADGGSLSSAGGVIAKDTGSTAVVTVAGAGSVWTNSDDLSVGSRGAGALDISNGGQVSNRTAYIGHLGGSAGRATVAGADSLWDVNGQLLVGYVGTGTIDISDGATVSAALASIAVQAGSTGTINIGAAAGESAVAAGTLAASDVSFGQGDGTLQFNHTDVDYIFAPNLFGAGSIRHSAGNTTYTGDGSGFTGGTYIQGGTLYVNGALGGTIDVIGGTLGGSGSVGDTIVGSGSTLIGQQGQTLTLASLDLRTEANVNVSLGAPGSLALFDVTGDLVLDGTLNVVDADGFGPGLYRLFDYGGTLTDNVLDIGTVPGGVDAADLAVQTAVTGQVNLVNSSAVGDLMFWDGDGHGANGLIDGGDGTWTLTRPNWTDANGWARGAMTPVPGFAVFAGTGGTVAVDDSAGALSVTGMQFASDGYELTGAVVELVGAGGDAIIRVGDGTAAGADMTATIASELTGSSGLVKDDLGTLILVGANGYAGGTRINAGTLQIGAGGTSGSIVGDVSNNGVLAFDRTDATLFGGTIDGSGAVNLVGGDLTLIGDNSYGGRTGIAIGATLRLGDGGTSGSIIGPVNTTGTLIFDRSDSVDFAGSISGAGTVRQSGSGTTNLTGNSRGFAGATIVEAGTLAVNGSLGGTIEMLAGGRLQGSGTVGNSIIRGTIAPGNSIGTLNVTGDISFTAGSIYEVEADATGQADRINATGGATLDGGTVQVLAEAGNYAPRTSYTILTADGGISGTFTGGVTSNLAFLDPSLSYDANNAYLRLTRNDISFAGIGVTPNQVAAGAGTESLGIGNDIFDAVLNLSTAQAQNAFDQLSGEIHASARTAMIEDSRFVRSAVWDRLRGAANGDRGGLWGEGFGSWGHTGSDGNAARLDRSGGGLLMGADGAFGGNVRVGAVTGYSRTTLDVDARGSSGQIDSYHLGVYVGGQWAAAALRTGIAYSWQDMHMMRGVAFPGVGDVARAGYDGGTFQAFGELGYSLDLGRTRIEPYASVAYVRARSDAFSETGDDARLTGAKAATDATFSTLGLRAATGFELGGREATLRAGAGWRHAFGSSTPLTVMRYAGGGDAFMIAGMPVMRDAATIDAGLNVAISGKASLGISYSGQLGSGLSDQTARASFVFRF
ncbi:autotransporter domain-containing protein [Sphingopyxis granuli]|uniref:autotransporter domain-containing protein n=1 Tax=Sphingopyxis granuli TaxID=267128 RepID=UPI001F5350F3|nr:autotransporter domain-containing protein [Sphingopyxis granuli]UNK79197.1 autotransporter domain-containing protein [Sphingopyxis granuli]